MTKKKITAQSRVTDVLRDFPKARKVFDRHGMNCRGCMGAAAETIGASAVIHGLDPGSFLRELQEAVEGGASAGA